MPLLMSSVCAAFVQPAESSAQRCDEDADICKELNMRWNEPRLILQLQYQIRSFWIFFQFCRNLCVRMCSPVPPVGQSEVVLGDTG